MKLRQQYRLFRRSAVFYIHNNDTGQQTSLGTKDPKEALRLFNAKNEAVRQPVINIQIARAYLMVSDRMAATRTWCYVMDEMLKHKSGETLRRWTVATKDKALSEIKNLPLLDTRAEHFFAALRAGKVSTNVYLRRIHNFALASNWLPVPVLQKEAWPAVRFKKKRAITQEEHQKIIEREKNAERRAFYELAWHTGASQSDLAFLESENISFDQKTLTYSRKKTGTCAILRFGPKMEALLRKLPQAGPLFPYLRTVRSGDRATEFKQRCEGLQITGVTLHSYRYAWAQRAKKAGMPLRFAQEALGHESAEVHRHYGKNGDVVVPPLEVYETQAAQNNILALSAA